MRSRFLMALAAALMATGLAATAAEAGCWRHCPPAGWGRVQTVTHHGYYPRYRHVYRVQYATDPYAYRYEPRGYYPYYNSGYWRPAHELRYRARYIPAPPPYYAAWGYPNRHYSHAWRRRHEAHRRHHW